MPYGFLVLSPLHGSPESLPSGSIPSSSWPGVVGVLLVGGGVDIWARLDVGFGEGSWPSAGLMGTT